MTYQANRLPRQIPVGTKLIVEGRPGRDGQKGAPVSRYLEFPDGTFLPLSSSTPQQRLGRQLHARAKLKRAAAR
jgi:hypothetical protein